MILDANLWATDAMSNSKCPEGLFLRVVTVSLEIIKVVNTLAPLNT